MSESADRALDPDEFVGEPPAGDASPGEVMSNDQSADPTDKPGSGGRHSQREGDQQ
jgi:hypothetical protein